MVYSDLVLNGKLYGYLADIDAQARTKLDLLVTQLAEKEGINEQLKAQNQMEWVRAMNNICNRAEEIVLQELIYGEDMALKSLKNFGMETLSQRSMTLLLVRSTKKCFD